MNDWPLQDLSRIYGIRIKDFCQLNKILYLDTSIGPLAVKRSTLTPEELQLQYNILRHLSNKGYDNFSKIIPTQHGLGFAHVDGNLYLITTWVRGIYPDFSNTDDLDLASRTLAQFHKSATGYKGPVLWQKRKLYGVWPMRFSYRLSHLQWYKRCIKARGMQDEFDQLFMEHVDEVLLQGYHAIESLRSPFYYDLATKAQGQGTVCHHDLAYHNMLIDENKNAWLIDFDYCLLDMPVHDLSNMISRHVKYTKWCLKDISRILLMYHQEKPLLSAELQALLHFLEFPQDFWQLAWAKYNELGMHRPEALLVRLEKLVGSQLSRQQFLAEFTYLVRTKNLLPRRDTL